MFKFDREYLIQRDQQELFDFLTNPANDSRWRDSAVSAEWTSPDPPGVGSTQLTVDKLLGRNVESTTEVTVWDPPNEFAWKSTSGPIPFEIRLNISGHQDGSMLRMSGQADFGGFFKLAEGLVGKQMEKQIDKDFKNLQALMKSS